MKLNLDSPATSSRRNLVSRSNPVRLGALALAVVFTASQMPAQTAPAGTPQAATQQIADTSASSTPSSATNTTADEVSSAPSDSAKSESNPLPETPAAPGDHPESASVPMSPELRTMFNDAIQASQNLQPAPKSHGVQRPGMLGMGIAGVPLIVFGTYIMTRTVRKDSGLKNGLGAAFLVPGAAMSGIGFTLAFKPKNK